MKRSQSSKSHIIFHQQTQQQQQQQRAPRQSLFPPIDAGWSTGALPTQPNARVAAVGRSLLNRPRITCNQTSHHQQRVAEHNKEFSASAADTPLRRTGTDLTMKSCLSSSSMQQQQQQSMHRSRSLVTTNYCHDGSSLFRDDDNDASNNKRNISSNDSRVIRRGAAAASSSAVIAYDNNNTTDYPIISSSSSSSSSNNEEFKLLTSSSSSSSTITPRNVSFSHLQVREYEVTLGDNPSVSSGVPISLGWRYNPNERISKLDDDDNSDVEVDDPMIRFSSACGHSSTTNNYNATSIIVDFNHNRISNNKKSSTPQRKNTLHKLSDRERHRRLSSNPHVSVQELQSVLQAVASVRLERQESLNELREERRLLKLQQQQQLLQLQSR